MKNEDKIYHLKDRKEIINYIRTNTKVLDNFKDEEIKQIESDYYNRIYVLLNNGNLYKGYDFYKSNVDRIWMLDAFNLYFITKENQVFTLTNFDKDMDAYLNNNNCKFKKIIYNTLTFVALTFDGKVISTTCDPSGFGIIPENFLNIDDILFIEEIPYIIKNNKLLKLFV